MKLVLIIVVCSINTLIYAQGARTVSLKRESIFPGVLDFKIVKVVDGREIKSNIGVVQKGINNKPAIAVFDESLENEFMSLILPLNHNSRQEMNIVLRIDRFEVSEVTMPKKEYATARITVDFFFELDSNFYFITRKRAFKKSTGVIDVTHQHASNIASVVEQVLKEFGEKSIENYTINEQAVTANELITYQPESEEELFEILQGAYLDGAFMSHEEFRDNKPSIIDGYKVEEGSTLSFWWIDENGKSAKPDNNLYAIIYNNKPYKYFQNEFYPIEKRSGKLIFFGKEMNNQGQTARNYAWGGMATATIGSAGQKIKMVYEIDLHSGEVKELGFMH